MKIDESRAPAVDFFKPQRTYADRTPMRKFPLPTRRLMFHKPVKRSAYGILDGPGVFLPQSEPGKRQCNHTERRHR
jgi:hypothetical protein